MTITMIVGSFIGGATAEGGGAVAFPVMTLILHLSPAIARDFSFMIQCCGKSLILLFVVPMFVKLKFLISINISQITEDKLLQNKEFKKNMLIYFFVNK